MLKLNDIPLKHHLKLPLTLIGVVHSVNAPGTAAHTPRLKLPLTLIGVVHPSK